MRRSRFGHFHKLLIKERTKILKELGYSEGIVAKPQTEVSGDISAYTYHMADQGSDTYQRELESKFITMENHALKEVAEALKRIENGTYGRCEECGKSISEARLEIIPYTRYCVDCQDKRDSRSKSK
ncbi:MAG TPA: hypothetical protein EYP58_05710 [bacterium (Candidatus Stahlbacteria)]|nr:hypothetical protein [Candidatus Stahlbacteria bacterium]